MIAEGVKNEWRKVQLFRPNIICSLILFLRLALLTYFGHLIWDVLPNWVHRRPQQIIELQNSMIISLMQFQGTKRILLTDDQRRLLAVKSKTLGRKTLLELTTVVHPRHHSPLALATCGPN